MTFWGKDKYQTNLVIEFSYEFEMSSSPFVEYNSIPLLTNKESQGQGKVILQEGVLQARWRFLGITHLSKIAALIKSNYKFIYTGSFGAYVFTIENCWIPLIYQLYRWQSTMSHMIGHWNSAIWNDDESLRGSCIYNLRFILKFLKYSILVKSNLKHWCNR